MQEESAPADIQKPDCRNGKELDKNGVDEELVAESAWSVHYPSIEDAQQLVQEKPGLVRRIVNWIDSMIAKMRGINDPEVENLKRTRELYRKCLETAENTSSQEEG